MRKFPPTNSYPPYNLNQQDYDFIRWKSGKRVDPRLLSILDSFADLYANRNNLFKKVFDGKYAELFDKIALAKMKKKKQIKRMKTMTRSMSMHAIGKRSVGDDIIVDGVKLERFKVRTPNVIVTGQDDGGGGGGVVQVTNDQTNNN